MFSTKTKHGQAFSSVNYSQSGEHLELLRCGTTDKGKAIFRRSFYPFLLWQSLWLYQNSDFCFLVYTVCLAGLYVRGPTVCCRAPRDDIPACLQAASAA